MFTRIISGIRQKMQVSLRLFLSWALMFPYIVPASFAIWFLVNPQTAHSAQSNLKMNYQGFLTNDGGSPVNDMKGFIFRVRDGNGGPV